MVIIYYLNIFGHECKENARINCKLITDVFPCGDRPFQEKLFNFGVDARVSLDVAFI